MLLFSKLFLRFELLGPSELERVLYGESFTQKSAIAINLSTLPDPEMFFSPKTTLQALRQNFPPFVSRLFHGRKIGCVFS